MATVAGTVLGEVVGKAVHAAETSVDIAFSSAMAAVDAAQELGPEQAQLLLQEINAHIDKLQATAAKVKDVVDAQLNKVTDEVKTL